MPCANPGLGGFKTEVAFGSIEVIAEANAEALEDYARLESKFCPPPAVLMVMRPWLFLWPAFMAACAASPSGGAGIPGEAKAPRDPERRRYEEILEHLQASDCIRTDILVFKKPLDGRILAVDVAERLTLSIGSDDGVQVGDEFTVYRDGNFVAKMEITSVGSGLSTGTVVLRKRDPVPGDEVSNHIFVSGPKDK